MVMVVVRLSIGDIDVIGGNDGASGVNDNDVLEASKNIGFL